MEENKNEENENGSDGIKGWLQENLRIIISIAIVVAIAGGIYSYSKRSQAPATNEENPSVEQQGNVSGEAAKGQEGVIEKQNASTEESTTESATSQKQEKATAGTSQETDNSFVETAGSGDGTTVLARRALANYLEKNPDSELTPEHKIYIEDYLRKHVDFKGKVFVGTSVEFSKELIQGAITQAKGLNDSQLKNLHKYAVRVPSLS